MADQASMHVNGQRSSLWELPEVFKRTALGLSRYGPLSTEQDGVLLPGGSPTPALVRPFAVATVLLAYRLSLDSPHSRESAQSGRVSLSLFAGVVSEADGFGIDWSK